MAAPYLIVGLGGDSNGMWGKYLLTNGTDDAGPRIFQYKQDTTIAVANEPLDNLGYGPADGQAGQVGSTVALCRMLRDGGYLPLGYDILIVPDCAAGTAFPNYWATTPPYIDGITGGRRILTPFIARLQAALALHTSNRIWFFDWNHGANDAGDAPGVYRDNMIATWGEIRATVATASRVPILVSGIPPNYVNPLLGNNVSLPNVIADQQSVATYLENAIYVSPAALTSLDTSNNYVHHTAVTHRGGTNNAPGNTGEVVTAAASLAGLKYAAMQAARFPMRLTWS